MANSTWTLDKAHSEIEFSIRHMMISRVKGAFRDFDAEIEADPADLTTANIQFTIDIASIDTGNEDRDNHLRSADFFEVEKYPKLTFTSTSIEKQGVDYAVTGNVSMHGATNTETFIVTSGGVVKDPMSGAQKAGFSVEGKIKRSDYGLTWNAPLETGGVLVSDEVKINMEIQASKAE